MYQYVRSTCASSSDGRHIHIPIVQKCYEECRGNGHPLERLAEDAARTDEEAKRAEDDRVKGVCALLLGYFVLLPDGEDSKNREEVEQKLSNS